MGKDNLPVHFVPEEMLEESSFFIEKFDRMDPITRSPYPHRHSFLTIFFIEGGKGNHIIDFEPFQIKKNLFFFLSPGHVHFWQIKKPLDGFAIVFTEDFLFSLSGEDSIIDDLGFFYNIASPCLTLNPDQKKSIIDIIQRIYEEFGNKEFRHMSVLQSYLRILLISIQRMYTTKKSDATLAKRSPILSKFRKMVIESLHEKIAIPEYAQKLGISEAYLYKIVKETSGLTPGQIINTEIILEAKRQIVHTSKSVAEVGYSLNFADPPYFCRFFKRETGYSPKKFRNHCREKYHFIR